MLNDGDCYLIAAVLMCFCVVYHSIELKASAQKLVRVITLV